MNLPRGTCHECGRNVALRSGDLLREHAPAPGAVKTAGSWCPGSGKALRQAKVVSTGLATKSRYELVDPKDNVNKFWELEYPAGGSWKQFRTSWGRIGQTPTSKVKAWPTEHKAQEEAWKLIQQKEGKGYKAVKTKAKGKARVPKSPSGLKAYRAALLKTGVVALGPAAVSKIKKAQELVASDDDHQYAVFAIRNGLFCTSDDKAIIVAPKELREEIRTLAIARLGTAFEHGWRSWIAAFKAALGMVSPSEAKLLKKRLRVTGTN